MQTMEVMVFKTSVETTSEVKLLRPVLDLVAGRGKWNFALDDCDRILRIASTNVSAETAIKLLNEKGYDCAELKD